MKKMTLILILLGLAGCSSAPEDRLEVVSDFDVTRYMGLWHQAAAIPAWFQRNCVADTTASYRLLENERVEVINRCLDQDGVAIVADGRARFQGSKAVPILEVSFVEILGMWVWAAGGDYWVIGMDPEYQWAVVGEPSLTYAWVLARDKTMDAAALIAVNAVLVKAGYDSCTVILTMPDAHGAVCDWARSDPVTHPQAP